MARSIHSTRKQLEETEQTGISDTKRQEAQVERIAKELERKRSIKRRTALDRQTPAAVGATPTGAIPIIVSEEGPFVHYPASPDDIRAVIRRLPQGVLDGVNSIELCIGSKFQGEVDSGLGTTLDRDPYTGRIGAESLPGVFSARVRGVYSTGAGMVRVFAYVYDPAIPDREMWEAYLRLCTLSVLVHEVAHHFDCTQRAARGRWLANEVEKVEMYAEHREHEWVQQCVIPYLEEAYGRPLKALQEWIGYHGGVAISMQIMAGDSRLRMKGGLANVSAWFGFHIALSELAQSVAAGSDLPSTRLGFARDLHYAGYYTDALACIASVLSENPVAYEALTLQADIYVHQERFPEAEATARKVLEADPTSADAWEVLADACEGMKRWQETIDAVDHGLALAHVPGGRNTKWSYLIQRSRARLELSDFDGAAIDAQAAARSPMRHHRRRATELLAEIESRRVAERPVGQA